MRTTLVDHLSAGNAVTRPLGAGNPDPLDLKASDQLDSNEAGRLDLVRSRAEKWIGGISALSGLLGTVLVVKGGDTVTQILLGWRIAVAVMVALALVLLAFGTYLAYQAAFGNPSALAEINRVPLAGLHDRLLQARSAAAAEALGSLATAIKAVFAAVAFIAVGVAITWFAPKVGTTSSKSVCVYSNGQLVAQLAGDSTPIKRTAPSAYVGSCR